MAVALLASPEDFAASRGVAFDPTEVAALIALEQASDLIRSLTDQDFDGIVTDDEVVLNGTGTRALLLPQLPVLSVSEVSTQWHWDADPLVLTEATDYKVDLRTGILWRDVWSVWPVGQLNIAVTYTHGYSLPGSDPTTLPMDLQGLCRDIALRLMTNAESGGQTVRQEQIGTYHITYDTSTVMNQLSPENLSTLAKYRRHQMA